MTNRTHPDSGRIITSGDVLRELHEEIETLRMGYAAARLEIESLRSQAPQQAAQAASVQEDAARLDFLIEQRAYVVSDPDACPGHWLHWARPDGRTWVQGDEHPTPRAAIDAARAAQEGK